MSRMGSAAEGRNWMIENRTANRIEQPRRRAGRFFIGAGEEMNYALEL
jgi:hypothetical protein